MNPPQAEVSHSKPSGLLQIVLIGIVLSVTVAGLAASMVPAVTCPKCVGKGLHRMIDPEGPPRWRGVTFQPVTCDFCSDRRQVSLVKQWQWHSEDAPAPPIYRK